MKNIKVNFALVISLFMASTELIARDSDENLQAAQDGPLISAMGDCVYHQEPFLLLSYLPPAESGVHLINAREKLPQAGGVALVPFFYKVEFSADGSNWLGLKSFGIEDMANHSGIAYTLLSNRPKHGVAHLLMIAIPSRELSPWQPSKNANESSGFMRFIFQVFVFPKGGEMSAKLVTSDPIRVIEGAQKDGRVVGDKP